VYGTFWFSTNGVDGVGAALWANHGGKAAFYEFADVGFGRRIAVGFPAFHRPLFLGGIKKTPVVLAHFILRIVPRFLEARKRGQPMNSESG